MAILIDANVLLRLLQPHHPHCHVVQRALSTLRTNNETLYVTAQNLVEFWAVATRPTSDNGLGMTGEVAKRELDVFRRLFVLLPESNSIFEEWERLVTTYEVCGKNTHDARLVAAMNVYGITGIVTFNVRDFAPYSNISALHPDTI
jgi:predicted nucleic acid-binding protein